MRDWSYKYENMPEETDEEFLLKVTMAWNEGTWVSTWMPRLLEISHSKRLELSRWQHLKKAIER